MLPQVADALVNYGVPLLVALFSFVATRLASWLNAHTKLKRLGHAMLVLNDAVQTAVRQVEQTLRPLFDEAAKDGVLTPEERAQLKTQAMSALKQYLGTNGLDHVKHAFGLTPDRLEALMDGKIEAAVLDMKQGKPASLKLDDVLTPPPVPTKP